MVHGVIGVCRETEASNETVDSMTDGDDKNKELVILMRQLAWDEELYNPRGFCM